MTIGIYYHIPFCQKICHYCDFAKTANYSSDAVISVINDLVEATKLILPRLVSNHHVPSIYFGGGTPSLLTKGLIPLMKVLTPYIGQETEVTLEANPEHITKKSLELWRSLGINRLSLGIQSFLQEGLQFLTREHTPERAKRALDAAGEIFENYSADLIYGWPGQSLEHFASEVSELTCRKVPHISLYNLTYEGQTVLARRWRRGLIPKNTEDHEYQLYQLGRKLLRPYTHEEVSNYALSGSEARHNRIYWTGDSYLGLGPGAHGFLQEPYSIGVRYHFPFSLRLKPKSAPATGSVLNILERLGAQMESRSTEDWLAEMVWTGLRSQFGVKISHIEEISKRRFHPNKNLNIAFKEGMINWDKDQNLQLSPEEWFRESLFVKEVIDSFV